MPEQLQMSRGGTFFDGYIFCKICIKCAPAQSVVDVNLCARVPIDPLSTLLNFTTNIFAPPKLISRLKLNNVPSHLV